MNKLRLVTALALGFVFYEPSIQAQIQPPPAAIDLSGTVPAQLLIARGALPNAARKLALGGPFSVVFLGGSITEGGGDDGYVSLVGRWLQKSFPRADVRAVSAGIGGTNSDYGQMRFDRDVLAFAPDLLFVEFAVNDDGRDGSASMETIVRKTWMRNPNTDIVFMHHTKEPYLPFFRAHRFPPAASLHEGVADFYGIPTIGTGVALSQQVEEGTPLHSLLPDGTHPNAAGYALYSRAITDSLAQLLRGTPAPHVLSETLCPNLVVYPQRAVARPQGEPVPFVSKTGERAQATFELPVWGVNWVESPQFKVDGRILWRLSYQTGADSMKLVPSVGTQRAAHGDGMIYFAGGNHFTAPNPKAQPLAMSENGHNLLGDKEDEFGVVSFFSPRAGRYTFHVSASGARLWGQHKQIALNAVVYHAGRPGSSIAFVKRRQGEATDFDIETTTTLGQGEEVAFVSDADANGGGGGAYWEDLKVKVGFNSP